MPIYITDEHGKACPNCGYSMTTVANYLPSAGSSSSGQVVAQSAAKGFAQGIVTYTVLDDLTVTPMSTISGITLLNTFAVKDLGDLQETTVQLGYNEVKHCWTFHLFTLYLICSSIVVGL